MKIGSSPGLPASSPLRHPHLQIHVCVILWGFTAILGRLISLPALPLVWWRMLSVAVVLLALPWVWRRFRLMSPRLIASYSAAGGLLALHWSTFYGSVKLANASVAATCMALATILLAVLEPATSRRPFDFREIALAVSVVPGIALAVGGIPRGMGAGIGLGLVSAVLLAGFGVLNKRLVDRSHPVAITALEFSVGAVLLTALAPLLSHSGAVFPIPDGRDALLLVVLVFACTILPFTLSLVALSQLSAFAAQLAINIEPLYVVFLAAVLLGEYRTLGGSFYLGAGILLAAVLGHPLLAKARHGR